MFQHIEPYAGDPILSLNEAFQTDPRSHKINLSIGIYFDDQGRLRYTSLLLLNGQFSSPSLHYLAIVQDCLVAFAHPDFLCDRQPPTRSPGFAGTATVLGQPLSDLPLRRMAALPQDAKAMYGKVKAFHQNTLTKLRDAKRGPKTAATRRATARASRCRRPSRSCPPRGRCMRASKRRRSSRSHAPRCR